MAYDFSRLLGNEMAIQIRDNRRELYDAGKSDRAIAKEVGRDRKSIWLWRTKAKLPALTKGNSPLPLKEQERRIAFHKLGLGDTTMAALCNITRESMFQWRKYHGLPLNRQNKKFVPLPKIQLMSMDADFGYGTAHGWLRDESWSNWLEEMGATVW